MLPRPKLASRRPIIIEALTTDPTRSYDSIAAEVGVSTHYVRATASTLQRRTGTVVRRQKLHRERNLSGTCADAPVVQAVAFMSWRKNRKISGPE